MASSQAVAQFCGQLGMMCLMCRQVPQEVESHLVCVLAHWGKCVVIWDFHHGVSVEHQLLRNCGSLFCGAGNLLLIGLSFQIRFQLDAANSTTFGRAGQWAYGHFFGGDLGWRFTAVLTMTCCKTFCTWTVKFSKAKPYTSHSNNLKQGSGRFKVAFSGNAWKSRNFLMFLDCWKVHESEHNEVCRSRLLILESLVGEQRQKLNNFAKPAVPRSQSRALT